MRRKLKAQEAESVQKCTLFELRVVHQGVAAACSKMYRKVWQLCTRGRDGLTSLLAEFTCQERSETPTNARHLTGCNIKGFIWVPVMYSSPRGFSSFGRGVDVKVSKIPINDGQRG